MPGFDSGLISGNQVSVMYAQNVDFTGSSLTAGSPQVTQNGQLLIGANAAPYIRVSTLTAGSGISVTNGPGTITIANTLSPTDLHTARFIVSAGGTADGANFTTIASAITSAVAKGGNQTVFIQPGTYTENLTLAAGINLSAYGGDPYTPNVIIVGKATATFAGAASYSGIQFRTSSDFCLALTGSAATVLKFFNCYINALNNTAISYTSSSGNSLMWFYNCSGDLATTGIAFFANSGAGTVKLFGGVWTNGGNSSTASTVSAGGLELRVQYFNNAITTSSTAGFEMSGTEYHGPLIHNATSPATSNSIGLSSIDGGSASAVTIGAGASLPISSCGISSSNTNAISGAGTLLYSDLSTTSSSVINTTTQTANYVQLGKWRAGGQPCFLAFLSAAGTGAAQGTVPFNTVVFDQNSNFTTGVGAKFTAPVAGKYFFTTTIEVNNPAGVVDMQLSLVATARTILGNFLMAASAVSGVNSATISGVIDMAINDTCTVSSASTGVGFTIVGSASPYVTSFSGFQVA